MSDALRLAVGTLTVLRVPAPRLVNRRVAGRAIALAPAVGLLLGLLAATAATLTDAAGLAPLGCAVVAITALAALNRGLHLDGLADTADGLGSGRRGGDGLVVMTRSDIGPFGVTTLVLVLLLQVAALGQLWVAGHGPAAVVLAAVASRTALPVMCRRSVPGAKSTGLGSAVAGTVGPVLLVGCLAVALTLVALLGTFDGGPGGGGRALVATVLGVTAAALLAARCVSRFGGITGDVLGAGVETTSTVLLLVLAATAT